MAHYDLPLDELQRYLPPLDEPEDFDGFWDQTLAEARAHDAGPRFEPVDAQLATLDAFDVSFPGFAGQPIKGWLLAPRARSGRLPCLVEYLGYGLGRGHATERLLWASAGFAHLVMDTRGQGARYGAPGHTPDAEGPDGGAPHHGLVTRGVADPAGYYYRRAMTDAVRAVDAARSHPDIDPGRIAVAGVSQGGGLALAAGAMAGDVVAVMADVPFLCCWRRGATIAPKAPYTEIAEYCGTHRDQVEAVFRTLSYFDGVSFAARGRAPALFSVALRDEVCPPSTVYAAYNRYGGPKRMQVYEFNDHEGGGRFQVAEQVRFLRELV